MMTSNVFISGIKSGQIWEKTDGKKKPTQKDDDNDDEFEELIEEKGKPEDDDIENIYGLNV